MPTTIVTGAGSGIGQALAAAFVARGHHVVVADLDGDAAERTAADLGGRTHDGGSAEAATLDVTDRAAVQRLVDEVEEAHGPLDTIVNNAGVSAVGWSHELDPAMWDRVFAVNLHGVVNGVLATYPRFIERGAGTIVNMASLSAFTPVPAAVAYASSKHAVLGLSRSLRAEAAAHGVRVHVVCPGFVDTPLLHEQVEGRGGLSFARIAQALRMPATTTEKVVVAAMRGIDRNVGVIVAPTTARATRWVASVSPDRMTDGLQRMIATRLRGEPRGR